MANDNVDHMYENMKNCLRTGDFEYFFVHFPYSQELMTRQMLSSLSDITQKRVMKLQSDAQMLATCGEKYTQHHLLADSQSYMKVLTTISDTLEKRYSQNFVAKTISNMKRSSSFIQRLFS